MKTNSFENLNKFFEKIKSVGFLERIFFWKNVVSLSYDAYEEFKSLTTKLEEINEGLNVIENWNSANSFIFYGKNSEINTNSLEDQEISVLSLHLLQNCLVYINTLMIQEILSKEEWSDRMQSEDYRALTPLIYQHINPYGNFELDMNERLLLEINRE